MEPVEISDIYFRRFMVPVVIAILVFAGIGCILAHVPGVKPQWETYPSVFGAQVAGALKSLRKK
jgi:hypothetical protein